MVGGTSAHAAVAGLLPRANTVIIAAGAMCCFSYAGRTLAAVLHNLRMLRRLRMYVSLGAVVATKLVAPHDDAAFDCASSMSNAVDMLSAAGLLEHGVIGHEDVQHLSCISS